MFDWLKRPMQMHSPLMITYDLAVLPSGVRVLRLHCSGYYPPGSAGTSHALQIYKTGAEALLVTDADAVLLDFTQLDYVWGDDLCLAFDIPSHESIGRDDCPTAVVVGPKCEDALKTLIEDGGGNWEEANLFWDEPSALERISRDASERA
ncbi:MAG TPA: hypothetical protein VGM54_16520 [Chthoniobacter sp.]|jgi:hypothetical protein